MERKASTRKSVSVGGIRQEQRIGDKDWQPSQETRSGVTRTSRKKGQNFLSAFMYSRDWPGGN